MSLDLRLLQEICDQISGEIDAIVSIFADQGEIIASSRRSRIGDFHTGCAKIMAGEANALEVTSEDAAGEASIFEGCAIPIEFEGKRVFCVGIAAPLSIARPYSRIVQHWVGSLLRERALTWSEQRFRDVAESAGDWIWEMNEELRFTYVSPRFFETFRVPPQAIIGKTRREFAVTNIEDQAWHDLEAKLLARLPFRDFTYSLATEDGRLRHLKTNGKPVYDEQGQFVGYRGTGLDITEQVEAEQALKRSQQLLSDAIETISEGFSLYDKDDRLVVFNSRYRTLLYPDVDVELKAGMTFESMVRLAAESGYIRAAIGREEDWVQERLARHREGREPHVQHRGNGRWILVSEHKTQDGGTVAVYSDITELKQREQELAEKSRALEQLSSQLAKYLSPQIYESIFTGRQEVKVASQRKKLTVFFSDIAGFTEATDRLESEELTQLLNHYLTEMSRIALDHGATIDKFVGDAIVVFFGDPDSQGVKEDALACVKMAIAMCERMRDLGVIWRDSGLETPLKCRIGINTGFCTVGNFGSEDRLDYTIIGGGVNLASRLESMATPGDILISYETYALVEDEIDCKEHGELTVKGIAYPVVTYQVLDSYTNLQEHPQRIRENHPKLSLNVDLDAMSEKEREQSADILRRALGKILESS
jgi:PAS domain S-box-containing protein